MLIFHASIAYDLVHDNLGSHGGDVGLGKVVLVGTMGWMQGRKGGRRGYFEVIIKSEHNTEI